jgi:MFS family permease
MSQSQPRPALSGMRAFLVVQFGQFVSLFGTSMARFGLMLWAWDKTGEATSLALAGFFGFAPVVIFGPVAGALVDRWNRKFAMMISDLAAGLSTVGLLGIVLLAGQDKLELWHVYVAMFVAASFESFQWPAYSAAISTMLDKSQYSRAYGLQSITETASGVFAPLLGGLMYTTLGLRGVLFLDVATFLIAIVTLLVVHIPQPAVTEEGRKSRSGSLFNELTYGFRYIFTRPSLIGLQMVFFFVNLFGTLAFTLIAPMILLRTANPAVPELAEGDKVLLGALQGVGAVGGVLGGLLMSVWGGFRRRVYGVLSGMFLESVLGTLVLGVVRVPIGWAFGMLMASFWIPLLNGSNQAIWQSKVSPDVQGRVFAVRRLIAQVTSPLAMLVAGPLADQVFEPAMREGGAWADTFGWLVGIGPGAGIALIVVLVGVLSMIVPLVAYAIPAIREVEDRLPDHVQAAPSPSAD